MYWLSTIKYKFLEFNEFIKFNCNDVPTITISFSNQPWKIDAQNYYFDWKCLVLFFIRGNNFQFQFCKVDFEKRLTIIVENATLKFQIWKIMCLYCYWYEIRKSTAKNKHDKVKGGKIQNWTSALMHNVVYFCWRPTLIMFSNVEHFWF